MFNEKVGVNCLVNTDGGMSVIMPCLVAAQQCELLVEMLLSLPSEQSLFLLNVGGKK